MKRYNFYCRSDWGAPADVEESHGGEYVLYDDAIAAIAAERERIADLWAGCNTEAEGHGLVDIGASIRAGKLVDAS